MGSFITNNIEGIWSKLKRLTDNFSGLNGKILNSHANLFNKLDFIILISSRFVFMEYDIKNYLLK